jgi:hypothetical protein
VKSVGKKFVIQEHARGGQTHWDLMLESGGILKTWRLDTSPDHIAEEPVIATKISNHDLKFLTYEGPVNKGLGCVSIVDEGTYEILNESEKKIRLRFQGKILSNEFVLESCKQDQWQFSKTL